MNREELLQYKEKLANLSEKERKLRDLELKKIASGIKQGPMTGYSSIDKPWTKYYQDEDIIGQIPQKRVVDVIYDNNINNMDDTALIYYNRKITFKELFENVDKAAKAFTNLGIKEGDMVSLIMPSLPETVYAFYALNRIGAISNLIDPRYNSEKIKTLINGTNSKITMVVNVSESKIQEIENDINCEKIFSVSPSESLPFGLKLGLKAKEMIDSIGKKKSNYESWTNFIGYGKDAEVKDASFNPDSVAAIVYTGGTTGSPKGAKMTTQDLNALAYHQESALRLVDRHSVYLGIMPPFIAFGLAVGLNNPLSVGAVVDLIPTFDHHKFAELITKHKPNHVIGVPSFWEDMANSKFAQKHDYSYLKTIVAGGDGMSVASEEKFNEFIQSHGCPNTKITKGYGMTEVTSCATYTCEDAVNKLGSVGVPLAQDIIKVVDPVTGDEKHYNETGEIHIYAPSIMGGYLNNEDETKNVSYIDEMGRQWIKSGDIGYIDSDGCVFIIDRIKHMIIRPDGFKVYPVTIEQYIMQNENIQSCKVVGGKDPNFVKGEFPVAYVVVNGENKESVVNDVKTICNEHLPEYQLPIDYIVKEELPLTPIGKVDVKKLQEEFNTKKLSRNL